MSEEKKQNIINKIKQLQIKQDELIKQLESLEINDTTTKSKNTNREIEIGDKVNILNPGRFQERSGEVCKIGKLITVQTKRGRKIVRVRKNLALVNDTQND
jgi:hypothetical protein